VLNLIGYGWQVLLANYKPCPKVCEDLLALLKCEAIMLTYRLKLNRMGKVFLSEQTVLHMCELLLTMAVPTG
jgi:hypothetical protein